MSGYIMDLRKVVGHRTLIQCADSIIIENEKGQILLDRRTDNHLWGYAGGSVEIDEKVEDCAKRELLEEMGPYVAVICGISEYGSLSVKLKMNTKMLHDPEVAFGILF